MDDVAFLEHVASRLAGLPAVAAVRLGGSRGEWVTNEKTLLARAGLEHLDALLAAARPEPESLRALVDQAWAACRGAIGGP